MLPWGVDSRKVLGLVLLLASCAGAPREAPPSVAGPPPPPETLAERERRRALERYRELRRRDWENYRRGRVGGRAWAARGAGRRARPAPARTRESWAREIDQSLAWFCMAGRTAARFPSDGACRDFAQDRLAGCRDRFGGEPSAELARCVGRGLR